MVPLDKVMLSEDDSHVLDSLTAKDSGSLRRRGQDVQWVGKHLDAPMAGGAAWWNLRLPSRNIQRLYPGLGTLTARQLDVIRIKGLDIPESGSGEASMIDVSQNLDRCHVLKGLCPCITPNGVFYHARACRPLVASETLRFQGILLSPDREREARTFSPGLLQSMAGNAFNTHCAMAAVAALLISATAVRSIPKPSLSISHMSQLLWNDSGESSESE